MSTLSKLGDTINEDYLGFNPTSNSTKPPHIANGLFRCVTGENCNTEDLHNWVLSEEKQGAMSSEEIIHTYSEILANGEKEDTENVKQLRYLLNEIFDHDKTVYPNREFSVYNVCCHWLISKRVPSEANIGDFILRILSYKIDGKRSPALDLMRKVLVKDDDDLSKILKPIISLQSHSSPTRNLGDIDYPNDEDIKWDECKRRIRQGFDHIAENLCSLKEDNNSLVVQERMVNFTGFAIMLYMINAKYADNGINTPVLIDSGRDLESIKRASEQSYTLAKKSVEDYYITSIYKQLKVYVEDTAEGCEQWLQEEFNCTGEKDAEDIEEVVLKYYNSFKKEGESPLLALSHALQIILYTFKYKNNPPSDFCRVIGVRFGIVGPRGNRANVKRYLFDSFSLETIALSVLTPEELHYGISFKEFGARLMNAYRIILGTDVEKEIKQLSEFNIAQNTPGDLRGDLTINSREIADIYISLGHGKRYADGVTILKWRA